MHSGRDSFPGDDCKLYGLIGFPLSHSFSRNYFTNKFQTEGITNSRYELFPLHTIDELPGLINAHPNLYGLNVTIPYKQQVLAYLNDVSALPLQACNCIKIEDGTLRGFNTDIIGFERSFTEKLSPYQNKALVLGTGGASLAVQWVLAKLNISFTVVSRNKGSGYTYQQLDAAIITENTIIINTTPLGTYPDVNACADIPYEFITPQHYCYDLVYNPEKSLFLQKAAAMGANIKNGADMLRIQAEISWEIWSG